MLVGSPGGNILLFYICLQLSSSTASFVWKPGHFEFRSWSGAGHKLRSYLSKTYSLISWCLAILGDHVVGKRSVQNADCILQTGFKMQTTHKMQTEFNAKCRLTRKSFFCCQKCGNIRFYKILILGKSPCLWYRWSRWDDYYLGGSRERGGNTSLGYP